MSISETASMITIATGIRMATGIIMATGILMAIVVTRAIVGLIAARQASIAVKLRAIGIIAFRVTVGFAAG